MQFLWLSFNTLPIIHTRCHFVHSELKICCDLIGQLVDDITIQVYRHCSCHNKHTTVLLVLLMNAVELELTEELWIHIKHELVLCSVELFVCVSVLACFWFICFVYFFVLVFLFALFFWSILVFSLYFLFQRHSYMCDFVSDKTVKFDIYPPSPAFNIDAVCIYHIHSN